MYRKKHSDPKEKGMVKLDLLSDPKARKILEGCKEKPCSIQELSRKENIPLNICHRIASKLKEYELLREEETIKRGKKEISLYRTVTDNAHVSLDEKELAFELDFSKGYTKLSMT